MSRRFNSGAGNIHAAVWLIGLGVLWLTNLWWPGILILVGVSMLVQVMVPRTEEEVVASPKKVVAAPIKAETIEKEADLWDEEVEETPAFIKSLPVEKNDALLPAKCPACGGPVAENAHKVEWIGAKTARCPFCDTVLNF